MEQSVNTFEDGMITDSALYDQKPNSYRHALNIVNNGDYGVNKLHNEKGNIAFTAVLPFKYLIASYVIDDLIVVFGTDNDDVVTNGNCEIGTIDNNGVYTKKVANDSVTPNVQLGFNVQNQIDIEARKLFNNEIVVYFTDNVNPMRAVNIDNPPITAVNFLEALQINTFQKVPYVVPNNVIDGGNIKAGIKQFVVRYLNDDLSPTTFGFVSPRVFISDDSETLTSRTQYDGASFSTVCRKSIEATVENIDVDFAYIEIAIIEYVEATTTPIIKVFRRERIDFQTSISFTYTGFEETIYQSNVNELNQALVLYSHAKAVTQKDNRLFWHNLKTKPTVNYQEIANTIKLKYTIEEIAWNQVTTVMGENITPTSVFPQFDFIANTTIDKNDYAKWEYVANKLGYMRGEVYAFGVIFVLKDGTVTPVYHLQGNDTGIATVKPYYVAADVTTKELGMFISTEQYDNVEGLTGNVKYHLMPTTQQEKIYDGDNIRILGIDVDLSNVTFPSEIVQYVIVRKERTDNNKSVLAQGLLRPLRYTMFDRQCPSLATDCSQETDVYPKLRPSTVADIGLNLAPTYVNKRDLIVSESRTGFFSPETVIYEKAVTTAQYVERLVSMADVELKVAYGDNTQSVTTRPYHWSYVDTSISTYDPVLSDVMFTGETIRDIKYTKNVVKNQCVDNNRNYVQFPPDEVTYLDNEILYAGNSNKYLALKLNTNRNFRYGNVELFNLRQDLLAQYGNIDNGSYIICGNPRFINNVDTVWYGGDVYVTKFANIITQDLWDGSLDKACHPQDIGGHIRTNDRTLHIGFEIKELQYFFVETTINTNLRHRPISEDNTQLGVDYFPHNQILSNFKSKQGAADGLFDIAGRFGNSQGYNVQYSKENNIRSYNTLPFGFIEVTEFPYRTIYSEQSTGQERSDVFKRYLPNNFGEIPKHTGEIWDAFVFENNLYVHTKHALYRTYVNEREALASTLGQVYTGVGSVFSLPPSPILTLQGGYGGSSSQFLKGETPFGYVFVDSLQQKVFMLAGGTLTDLTEFGISLDFNKLCKKRHNDNPAWKQGFTGGYDGTQNNKRFMLSFVDRDNVDSQFTLSFSFLNKRWVSYHEYVPNHYVSKDNSQYAIMNTRLNVNDTTSVLRRFYQQAVGTYGQWFGNAVRKIILRYIMNENVAYNKTLSSLLIDSKSYTPFTDVYRAANTFKTLQIRNTKQNTGIVNLICNYPFILHTTNVRLLNGRYNVAVPKNRLIANQNNVYNAENDGLLTTLTYNTKADRMRDTYFDVEFTYDNEFAIMLNYIAALYLPFIR